MLLIITLISVSLVLGNLFWQPSMSSAIIKDVKMDIAEETDLIRSNYSHWLRNTVIRVPRHLKRNVPNDTLRIGYNSLHSMVMMYLVPRNGSGIEKLIYTVAYETKDEADLLGICKSIAKSPRMVNQILTEYLEGEDLTEEIQYKPPRIIDMTVDKEPELLGYLLKEHSSKSCAWQMLVTDPGQPYKGDVERIEWLPSEKIGCRIVQEPICYVNRGTHKHPKVSCAKDCRVYQEVIDLLEG